MIFVLGLGHKLRNIPIVTILIIVICSIYYFGFQSRDTPYNEMRENNISLIESAEFLNLFEEYLLSEKQIQSDKLISKKVINNFSMALRNELSGNNKIDENKFILVAGNEEIRTELLPIFTVDVKEKHETIIKLDSYQNYKKILNEKNLELVNIHKKYNLLSKHNNNLISAVTAMFSHGGIWHLFGNMIFLFFFGRYVEQRYGSGIYFAVYFVGGVLAMMGFALFQGEDSYTNVLGASANVSVIMGAFYISFLHHKMKGYVWYFFMGKVVELSVKKYFVILFIIQDVIFSFSGNSGVAHLAHVNGLILGMIFAYIWNYKMDFPPDFLYPFELDKWRVIQKEHGNNYYKEVNYLLKFNPGNSTIKSDTRKHIFKTITETGKLTKEMHQNLLYLIPDYIEKYTKSPQTYTDFYKYMNVMSSKYMPRYLKNINQKKLLFLIDNSIDSEEYFLSIHFIHNFYTKYPRSGKLINMGKTLKSILDHSHEAQRIQKLLFLLNVESNSNRFNKIVSNYIISNEV
jgi:membrane associated rhomboid family serine protease